MSDDQKIITGIRQIMDSTGLTYTELASGAHVSSATVRRALEVGELPARSDPRIRLARFVDVNRTAVRRSDVRFV